MYRSLHEIHKYYLVILIFSAGVVTGAHSHCQTVTPQSINVLNYTFEPLLTGGKPALRISLDFRSGAETETEIELPSASTGQPNLEGSITELKALSPGTILVDTQPPGKRRVRYIPNSLVRLSYVVARNWDGPLTGGNRFRADISNGYFHIIGKTSLVHPVIDDLATVEVHFDWQKLPVGWSLATSFGADDRCQSFHGAWHQAINSLFVGGDYRIYRTTVSGGALIFAIRGKWSFADAEWLTQVGKIIKFERAFWHDDDFPYFLVTLTPLEQDHGSTGGAAFTNAFTEHLSRLDPITSETLGQLAHETFHVWNPVKMGRLSEPPYSISWFFEGFTVYYQDLMLFRAGLLSFPDYLLTVNQRLRNYAVNEGTEVSLQEFMRWRSTDGSALSQLEYRRGAVLAMWADATIRRRSANRLSLDDVMAALIAQNFEYQRRHDGQSMALDSQRILQTISSRLSGHERKILRQYVWNGGSIPIPKTAYGPCVRSAVKTAAKFDLGFDHSSTAVAARVERDSEAYRAGLRNGQKLGGWSYNPGDTSRQVSVTIVTDHGNELLKYYPRGRETSVQQFTLDHSMYSQHPDVCAAALRGFLSAEAQTESSR